METGPELSAGLKHQLWLVGESSRSFSEFRVSSKHKIGTPAERVSEHTAEEDIWILKGENEELQEIT
jgi:hypothetical protein